MAEAKTKKESLKRKHVEENDSEDDLYFAYEKGENSMTIKKNEKINEPETEAKKLKAIVREDEGEEKIKVEMKKNETQNKDKQSKEEEKKSEEKNEIESKIDKEVTKRAQEEQLSSIENLRESSKKENVSSPKQAQSKSMVQSKLSFFTPASPKQAGNDRPIEVIKRPNGEWQIEDYLVEEQWRRLLKEEFEKEYFKKINAAIKEGYKKNIIRPPKELVFNALNSTKLNQV
jgi:hypothetical protein